MYPWTWAHVRLRLYLHCIDKHSSHCFKYIHTCTYMHQRFSHGYIILISETSLLVNLVRDKHILAISLHADYVRTSTSLEIYKCVCICATMAYKKLCSQYTTLTLHSRDVMLLCPQVLHNWVWLEPECGDHQGTHISLQVWQMVDEQVHVHWRYVLHTYAVFYTTQYV